MVDPQSFQAVGWTLLSIGAIAVAYNQIDESFKRRKEKPSAQEVQNLSLEKFATIEQLREVRGVLRDFDKVADDFATTKQLAEIKETLAKIVEESDERRRAIYRRMDEHRDALSKDVKDLAVGLKESQTHWESQNQQVVALGAKLDRFLERALDAKHDR